MLNIENDIKVVADELLKSDEIKDIFKIKIKEGIKSAIENSFKWGELKKVIESKINEVLVPFIEKYDFNEYLIKLDTILTEIVNETSIDDNKKILNNFKNLMIEPIIKEISLEEIFEKYKEYVGYNMDCTGRDIEIDDEPSYIPILTKAEIIKNDNPSWSFFETARLELSVDEEEQENLNFIIELQKYKDDENYSIKYFNDYKINSLRSLSDFEIFLIGLDRSNIKIFIKNDFIEDEVYPEEKPEASYY